MVIFSNENTKYMEPPFWKLGSPSPLNKPVFNCNFHGFTAAQHLYRQSG